MKSEEEQVQGETDEVGAGEEGRVARGEGFGGFLLRALVSSFKAVE